LIRAGVNHREVKQWARFHGWRRRHIGEGHLARQVRVSVRQAEDSGEDPDETLFPVEYRIDYVRVWQR